MGPIDQLKAKLTSIADSIRERTGETDKLTLDQMAEDIEYMPAGDDSETYILVDEDGNEIPAVLTDEEVDLTATANDIREGVVAVTDDGVITGEKEIPSYNTREGVRVIPNGTALTIPTTTHYDYTKLQAIVCAYNTSLSNSVSAQQVVINDDVYEVDSVVSLSSILKDGANSRIDFGLTNTSGSPNIIRFFMYKEIY